MFEGRVCAACKVTPVSIKPESDQNVAIGNLQLPFTFVLIVFR